MERDNKKDGRAAELDRFWDIDALLPTRRVPAVSYTHLRAHETD